MPFYRILSEWDEIVEDSDLDVDDARERANQQARGGERETFSASNRNISEGRCAMLCYAVLCFAMLCCAVR